MQSMGKYFFRPRIGEDYDKGIHGLSKKQIVLYDANVILYCGNANGQNLIFDFVKSQYLDYVQLVDKIDKRIYDSPSTRKRVIDSYHHYTRIGYIKKVLQLCHSDKIAALKLSA